MKWNSRWCGVVAWVLVVLGGVLGAQEKAGDVLRVGPADGVTLTLEPGDVAPLRGELVVTNPGPNGVEWRASCDVDWLELKRKGGTLKGRVLTPVIVEVNAELAARLGTGRHVARVRFQNLTNGAGSTVRAVELIVVGTLGLVVREVADGGFEVTHEGAGAIEWTARGMAPFVGVEPKAGTLEAGERVRVRVSVDAERLERWKRNGRAPQSGVAFVNATDGVGSVMRAWRLEGEDELAAEVADGATGVRRRSQLSQFGVTWTFDREYEVGRFANGDPWVVGPVMITGMDPGSKRERGRTLNGAMVNPTPKTGMRQGYDSAMYAHFADKNSFDETLNVALGVSRRKPLLLDVHSSLVSSISLPKAGARPQLATAAILTVLDRAARAGGFRPAYTGGDKTVRFNADQLDRARLTFLPRVASAPSLDEVERMFARPWLDHVPKWIGRYLHPKGNMPDYGREITDQVGTGALMLLADFPLERKEKLLVSYVQVGIDLYGLLQQGQRWPPAAGHLNGRKWPILFAGVMLGDADMMRIGKDYDGRDFSEDGQTFYVERAIPELGYLEEHVGLAEWSSAHTVRPELDDPRWFSTQPFPKGATDVELRTANVAYRLCCTANVFWGQVLAARILGVQDLWNHDALFDYQDRFFEVNKRRGIKDVRNALSEFGVDMWREYRPKY